MAEKKSSDSSMQVEDVLSLRGLVEEVAQRDHLVGRVLHLLLSHLAHAHSVSDEDVETYAAEQAKAAQEAILAVQPAPSAKEPTNVPQPVRDQMKEPGVGTSTVKDGKSDKSDKGDK